MKTPLVLLFWLSVLSARVGPVSAYPPHSIKGDTDSAVTQETIHQTICVPNYTSRVRSVSEADKDFVLKRDLGGVVKGCCEVDHLISLELGGTNDRDKNLWAQPYSGNFGAREKDKVENTLHRMVCRVDDPMPLKVAQKCIVNDWIACGRKIGAIEHETCSNCTTRASAGSTGHSDSIRSGHSGS